MSNVIDLGEHKRKKELENNPGSPLYMDHNDGKIRGNPHFRRPTSDDFSNRMQRIKASLEKINFLMAELKRNRDK